MKINIAPPLNRRSMPEQLEFIVTCLDEQIATERALHNNSFVKQLLVARTRILEKKKRLEADTLELDIASEVKEFEEKWTRK